MRVLVIEDSSKMSNLLRRGLSEEGYAVDLAANGVDGVWMATEIPFDAIILDVMLPDLDGFEVCRQLRRADRWGPLLIFSPRDDATGPVGGRDAGGGAYFPKAFSPAPLF